VAHLIDQADIEDVIGVKKLIEHTDDDGDGVADPNVVDKLLEKASAYARGALVPGYGSQAVIDDLVANDPAARNDVTELAIGLMGKRREQMLGEEGASVYSKWFQPALDRLRATGRGAQRSAGEEVAGQNQVLPARIEPSDRQLMFGSTSADPYRSGLGY
jgi:hypothetical protein